MASVLVVVAEGSEELEAVTIIDILRRAQVEVVVAGLKSDPIRCSRGTVLVPDVSLDEASPRSFDMMVLPGGQPGTNNLEADPRVHSLLKRMQAEGRFLAAICAAPKVLAAAGALDGKRATCFPDAIAAAKYPLVQLENRPVVVDGKVVTSRGPGTAMDFALELVRLLSGKEKRESVEAGLQRPQEGDAVVSNWS